MILFVDMDEVMADTYTAHIEYYNKEFGESLSKEECMGHEVWQKVPEERRDSIWQHYYAEGFFRGLRPMPSSIEVLKELNEKYALYVASAAMQFPNSLLEKHQWLDEYFPFIHWKNRILCGDKKILRGDILIDDRSHNLENFIGRPLLYTSPHNIHTNHFERVNSWEEIAKELL
ncbi:MAG: HAD hydrolase-like protein [Flavobacteriaceae bacterium]|nr:HAD hydrolase-like protein [Muriicola sp.]MBT8289226.1 HAD hydrolase-like protein [Muriicola sp.]NNC62319.1 HAD hydrolase-like protein [Eudoraea sp.]NNK34419.1 HAD hydrolase-like protein [Eudoraea sp.]NNL38841.1 HAD hydrolase-like protein [Flavobacteriaceae bacterium]